MSARHLLTTSSDARLSEETTKSTTTTRYCSGLKHCPHIPESALLAKDGLYPSLGEARSVWMQERHQRGEQGTLTSADHALVYVGLTFSCKQNLLTLLWRRFFLDCQRLICPHVNESATSADYSLTCNGHLTYRGYNNRTDINGMSGWFQCSKARPGRSEKHLSRCIPKLASQDCVMALFRDGGLSEETLAKFESSIRPGDACYFTAPLSSRFTHCPFPHRSAHDQQPELAVLSVAKCPVSLTIIRPLDSSNLARKGASTNFDPVLFYLLDSGAPPVQVGSGHPLYGASAETPLHPFGHTHIVPKAA